MSAFYQIEVVQGEAFTTTIPYCDINGDPIDLSSASASLVVRKYHRDAEPQFVLSIGSGITVGGVDNNELVIVVSGGQNERDPGPYVWELRVTIGGVPKSLLRGPYKILAGAV